MILDGETYCKITIHTSKDDQKKCFTTIAESCFFKKKKKNHSLIKWNLSISPSLVLGGDMVISPSGTKIMQKMYFEHCDYKTYDFVPSHSFLLNFILAGWSVLRADSLISSLYCQFLKQMQQLWQAAASGNFTPGPKSALSPLQLSALWALMLQEHQSMIISLIVYISAKRRMTFLSVFLLTCYCSQYPQWRKRHRPDQCPAGLLAGARVLIKVFCR